MTIQSLQLTGILLAERYLIGANIKQGSYSEIYEAFDQQARVTVIIKVLNTHLRGVPDPLLRETLIRNFQQESDLQKRLRHLHIVELLDEGIGLNRDGNSFRYIVLEYLGGDDMELHCKGRPLKFSEVIYYFGQVVPALAAAHERDIIHRDLKPGNFLFSSDRKNVKIADFGVARLLPSRRDLITRVGTPIYSPPEHNPLLGTEFDKLTPASDVYSFAKTIYAVLAGSAPSQFRTMPITSLPTGMNGPSNAKLLSILRRATANELADRYQSIKHFWGDLLTVSNHAEQLTEREPALTAPRPRSRVVVDVLSFQKQSLELVAVTNSGKLVSRGRGEAKYFVEDLGDDVRIEMIQVPAGRFLMGSPKNEAERLECEGPQHYVTVPSFLLSRFPITQQQWRKVARLPALTHRLAPAPSTFKGDRRPVEGISWHDAVEFCERVSRATRRTYRLPSESEWEYACRAGTMNPFCFGDTLLPRLANFDSMLPYKYAEKHAAREGTVAVDELPAPNAFGVIGMHGNVWEWCQDTWHANYYGAPADGSAWIQDGSEKLRVARGGSWFNAAWLCRSAYRYAFVSQSREDNCGLRLAADI